MLWCFSDDWWLWKSALWAPEEGNQQEYLCYGFSLANANVNHLEHFCQAAARVWVINCKCKQRRRRRRKIIKCLPWLCWYGCAANQEETGSGGGCANDTRDVGLQMTAQTIEEISQQKHEGRCYYHWQQQHKCPPPQQQHNNNIETDAGVSYVIAHFYSFIFIFLIILFQISHQSQHEGDEKNKRVGRGNTWRKQRWVEAMSRRRVLYVLTPFSAFAYNQIFFYFL